MSPDLINALFEGIGSLLIWKSIIRLHRDKKIRGVHWMPIMFFCLWGYWNLFYYPHLEQWYSFAAGISMVTSNTIWILQMLYYEILEKKYKHLEWVEATDEYMGL